MASTCLIDLTGPMTGSRMGILARRPAPIQVSFLGWPGTTGADCIDYVIGDPVSHPRPPPGASTSEKIVQMPICYQPSDPVSGSPLKPNLTRADCGLPDDAFVFCSFNNTLKLTPDLFDLWLRVLSKTRNSVLWLYGKTAKTNDNLSEWAEARGIAAERIVFAPVAAMDVYLGRMTLADLFPRQLSLQCRRDLQRCALGRPSRSHLCWGNLCQPHGGEPVESRRTFGVDHGKPCRLRSPGGTARNGARPSWRPLRQRLARRRDSLPVFDMPKFTMRFEAALHHMRERWTARQSPEGFSVGS